MKQAQIILHLSKEHSVPKNGVTPIEAMILTAEHHRNYGGNPIEVMPGTEEDAKIIVPATPPVPELVENVAAYKDKDGKDIPAHKKVIRAGSLAKEASTRDRTEDEEILRLRRIYHGSKIDTILNKVRDLPKTFDDATTKGVGLQFPENKLGEKKII